MMSGQFSDEILDPEIRELGFVVDRDAIRARLEQEIGFADFGKYAREQFLEGLPRIGRIKMPDGSFLDPVTMSTRVVMSVSARCARRRPKSGSRPSRDG
jgi:hypothetical protein